MNEQTQSENTKTIDLNNIKSCLADLLENNQLIGDAAFGILAADAAIDHVFKADEACPETFQHGIRAHANFVFKLNMEMLEKLQEISRAIDEPAN